MTTLADVLADLRAESARLDDLVAGLTREQWSTPTPAEGWDVRRQVGHLAATDDAAIAAASDPAAWEAHVLEAAADPERFVDDAAERRALQDPEALLASWRAGRERLASALQSHPHGERMPWFGPPMSATSMATARYMETWAHARDVAEALGAELPTDDGVRHVVHLGVRTRAFSFLARGEQPPGAEVRLELLAPSGAVWAYGPVGAPESVTGSAHDFALLVTRRRHRDDLALVADGDGADRWLDVAQAFAGPPGVSRPRTGT